MFVTCYCDASFKDERGRYAIWLVSKKGRIKHDGDCPYWIQDNNAAELYAAYEGIRMAVQTWEGVSTILVCSDSQNAIRAIWPWTQDSRRKDMGQVEEMVHRLIEEHKLAIKTKHVKGHQKNDGTRSKYINNWCDRTASQRNKKGRFRKRKN